MRRPLFRASIAATIVGILVSFASCVELTGQRITMRYDDGKDQLLFLIQYDGIHDVEGKGPPGAAQIPLFLRDGDVMLIDWPFHLKLGDIRREPARIEGTAAQKVFWSSVLEWVEVKAIGRYRDPDGRIGAAQLVTVSHAKELLRKLNAYLSDQVIRGDAFTDWPRTRERMRSGALEGRQWLSIDGHSLEFAFPADPGEWSRRKSAFVSEFLKEWMELTQKGDPGEVLPSFYSQALSLFPFSVEESSDEIALRLGERSRSSTFRFSFRSAYSSNLEAVMAAEIGKDLDEELWRALLTKDAPADGTALETVITWGPPEEKVRALLAAARKPDDALRREALQRLDVLGAEIEKDGRLPSPPATSDQSTELEPRIQAWSEWYVQVVRGAE
jgi:hypothetical protein